MVGLTASQKHGKWEQTMILLFMIQVRAGGQSPRGSLLMGDCQSRVFGLSYGIYLKRAAAEMWEQICNEWISRRKRLHSYFTLRACCLSSVSLLKIHKGMGYVPGILPCRTSVQSLILLFIIALQASRVWVQNKVDESKHEIHSQVDAITAGTASVVNLTAGKCQWEGFPCNLLTICQSNSRNMNWVWGSCRTFSLRHVSS